MTEKLTGKERKYLRGLAHDMKPLVQLGQKGVTDTFLEALDEALETHELIKMKFIDFKDEKKVMAPEIAEKVGAELVGMIGNVAIYYRMHKDPEKRKISLKGADKE